MTITPPSWTDLSRTPAGLHVSHEAAWRRRAEGPGADLSWRVGAEGERLVAGVLAGLARPTPWQRIRGRPPRWHVLHSVPIGPATPGRLVDIDHLLVGPPGVVTINTKHHRRGRVVVDGDAVRVGGLATGYVARSREEAAQASALLGAALERDGAGRLAARLVVRPFITVVGGLLRVHRWPSGVTVTTAGGLTHALRSLPAVLDAREVAAVHEQARRSSTWIGR